MSQTQQQELESAWSKVETKLSKSLARLGEEQFLIAEYEAGIPDASIYAQFTAKNGQVQCEVVSEEFLPEETWPINDQYLVANGWQKPSEGLPNWLQEVPNAELAASVSIAALRQAHSCVDPELIHVTVDSF